MPTLEKEKKKIEERKLRFIDLKSDTTFKYLYKNEKTRVWFHRIIKEKFGLDLSTYKIVDNELNTGNNVKDYRIDINLEKGNTAVIIEMNKDYYDFLETKSYQYLFRTAGRRFLSGEDYENTQTKLILFNNFRNEKIKELKTGNYIFMDPLTGLVIEDIESYEIYLPNFKNSCYDSSEVDVSLSLFSAKSYDNMRELTSNPLDLLIIEELERLAMDESFLFEYDREIVRKKTENSIRKESYNNGVMDGMEKGIKQGMKQGVEQGEKNKQIEIARNLLKTDLSLKQISKATTLSEKEIEEIANE